MNITFVAHSFPPMHLGGVATYTYGVAQALRARGHEVQILCADDWAAEDLANSTTILTEDRDVDGLATHRLRFNALATTAYPPLNDVWNPGVEQYARVYFAAQHPDVIHVTGWVGLSPSIIAAAQHAGIPVVLTLTDYGLICPTANLLRGNGDLCTGRKDGIECLGCTWGTKGTIYRWFQQFPSWLRPALVKIFKSVDVRSRALALAFAVEQRNRLYPQLLSNVDYVVSPSRFLRQIFVDSGIIAAEKIHYQAHGHDVQAALPGRDKTPAPGLRFAYLGRIVPYKGVHLLIAAFNQLAPHYRAELHLYGNVDEIPAYGLELRALAQDNPAVQFRGRFDHHRIGQVLADTDVLVLPSTCYENAPVVLAEAFASHTPVIATNLGGMSEVVQHGKNGLLFERGDVLDLARQMQRLVKEPGLMEQMKNEETSVKTVSTEVTEWEAIYAKVSNL